MKVLFVHDGPIHVDENNEYYAFCYDNNLKNRYLQLGDSITFMMRTEPMEGEKYTHINKEKLSVISIPNFKSPSLYFKNYKLATKKIEETVKEHDKIIIRLPSSIGNIALKYAKKYNKNYIVEVVGCIWDSLWNYSFIGKCLAPIEFIKMKKNVNKSAYVIYVTEQFLQKRYPTKGISVNCSNVILPEIKYENLAKKLRKYENFSKDRKIILGTTAAVDVKYKGQDDVIKSISKLKKDGYNIEYQLVGGGSPEYLKKVAKKYEVEDNIVFIGKKVHKEVLEWLENIDIYIQPSKQEGLPRALIEAMSMACMCIGSTTAGIPELLEDKYIFKRGKVEEIIDIIKSINKEDLIISSKRNIIEAEKYTLDNINQRRNTFYKMSNFL